MHDTETVRSANLGSKLQNHQNGTGCGLSCVFVRNSLAEMRERRGGGGRVVAQGITS